MEPAEVVIGILGLAGLVGACTGAVNAVRTYLSFDTDSNALDARFASAKLRFDLWAQYDRSGHDTRPEVTHQALSDSQATVIVQRVIPVIQSLCGASDADPRAIRPPTLFRPATAPLQGIGRKLAWVLWRRARRTSQVEDLETLVQHLHNLRPVGAVPPPSPSVPRGPPWHNDYRGRAGRGSVSSASVPRRHHRSAGHAGFADPDPLATRAPDVGHRQAQVQTPDSGLQDPRLAARQTAPD